MKETTIIKRQFFQALKCGTGEAYLIVKENPQIDFSSYLIKGALKNYAYDGQSEDSRAQYIFDIISISKNKRKIRKSILQGLATEQEDTWSLTHLFDLVKLYAKQGDKEAKAAIYDRFLKNQIFGSDWVGYQQILELDGLNGLFYIAENFGKQIEKDPEDWQDSMIIKCFQSDNPDIKVNYELNKAAKKNKYIRLYLNNIKRTENNWKNNKTETKTFKNIIDEVLSYTHSLPYRRLKKLNNEELIQIGQHLLKEKDKSKLEKLLTIFTSHKFPFDSEFILKLAKQKATSKNRINEYAIDSLKFLSSKNIRDFALEKIPKTKYPAFYCNLLISNYKNGDHQLLNNLANKYSNEHIIENLARTYIEIYKINKTKECKKPLETLYRKMNCGIHRKDIIEILIENNVLPTKIFQEIQYDSDLETRQLYKNELT